MSDEWIGSLAPASSLRRGDEAAKHHGRSGGSGRGGRGRVREARKALLAYGDGDGDDDDDEQRKDIAEKV